MDINDFSLVTVKPENLESEHICCAMSDKKSAAGVANKKAMMSLLFDRGYRFKKIDVRGKVFIEYMPAEIALRPVIAPGYWFIQCLWVSGKYKGQGFSRMLLEECLEEAKGSNGIAVVTSNKPFLTEKKFFLHHGFEVVDTAPPHFELLVRKYRDTPDPKFAQAAKDNSTTATEEVYIEYSDQCPFTEYYVALLERISSALGLSIKIKKLVDPSDIQLAVSAYATFSLFLKGAFVTHVIPTENQFNKMLQENGLASD